MKPVIHTEAELEVVSRITELLISQKKTQTKMLEYFVLHRNNYTEWKAGRKRSYLLYMDEIARCFDVSPTYLLRGGDTPEDENNMNISKEERELILMYRCLNQESKNKMMATADVLVNLERSDTSQKK